MSPSPPLQLQQHLASLSMEDLSQLEDITMIQNALAAVANEEAKIDQELEAFLGSEKLGHQMLLDIIPQFEAIANKAAPLADVVSAIKAESDAVCGRLKELDEEQKRVQSAIQRINDIQDLKRCVVGIQSAIQAGDYEAAAGHVHRYLHFDPTTLRSALDDISHSTAVANTVASGSSASLDAAIAADANFSNTAATRAAQVLADGRQQLKDVIIGKFTEATESGDERAIARFFKLFPLVGEAEMGLSKYANYVCAILSRKCQDAVHSAEQARHPAFVELLTRLYENIASLIDQHSALVETHYGPGQLIRIIQRFYQEAETQSRVILDMWSDTRHFKRLMAEVRTGLSHNATTVESRDVDAVLSEIAMFSSRVQLYHDFVRTRARHEMEVLRSDRQVNTALLTALESNRLLGEDGLPLQSSLEEYIMELLVSYIAAEEFFLQKSIAKALELDEVDVGGHASSCVDDTFYVLKKCLMRGISTCDIDTCCAVMQSLAQVLESDFVAALKERLSSFTSLSSSSADGEQARSRYMVQLNNLDVSASYLPRLVQDAEASAVVTFRLDMVGESDASDDEHHGDEEAEREERRASKLKSQRREKLSSCLISFLDLEKQVKRESKLYLDTYFGQVLKPRCLAIARELFRDIVSSSANTMQSRYILSEEEYSRLDADYAVVARNPAFIKTFDSMMQQPKNLLTSSAYVALLLSVIETLLKECEKVLMQSRFNQLGALQFDKDIRSLASFFSAHQQAVLADAQQSGGYQANTSWPAQQRDKFTKINQISQLLNLESVSELHDYWGSRAIAPISWRLTLADAKKVLGLRLEFKADDIAKFNP
ncbi:Golgi transport complex subunit 4 [Sorochytrium milnesiophthora]